MDWDSPTTKKHIAEAKAQGCELIGPGSKPRQRDYRLPCGHEREARPDQVRKGRLICRICPKQKKLFNWSSEATLKHIAEAEAQSCELLGPGRSATYRQYRLPCDHQQEVHLTLIRKGNFRCQTCLQQKLTEEAKAIGCDLLGEGRSAPYRIYRLPCGHDQEIQPGDMRRGSFRCEECLATKLITEAEAQSCKLLGPGTSFRHRRYRLPCGHEREIEVGNMRRGSFRCITCHESKLREDASAQGCKILREGKEPGSRIYRLPCGHDQDIRTNHVAKGQILCWTCLKTKLNTEAEAQGCVILRQGTRNGTKIYSLPCGHEQEIDLSSMRTGEFRCAICFQAKLDEEAEAQGCVLLGEGRSASVRLYRLPCGHEQEIGTHQMRNGGLRCQICVEEKLDSEAEAQGCVLLDAGKSSIYRLYRLECGHEVEIQTGNMRLGNFRCLDCFENKLVSEAEIFGCRVSGPGKDANYRVYRLECGHSQEIVTSSMRVGSFRCRVCEEWAYTQPSNVYLIHIRVGSDEWLKLGYAKNVDFRASRYGLPTGAEVTVLATMLLDTGKEAQDFEQSLHKKHKRKRLRAKDMQEFHTGSGATECYPVTMVDKLMTEFHK